MAKQTERVDHLDAALRIAELGWPCFPLAPRSKQPLISAEKGGHGLHDATTDPAVIKAWWQARLTANIGLRTGVAFDVIDLDTEAAVDELESVRAGRERISGPVVATGNGYHYFVLPTGFGNRAGVLPGVDFRGRDGYVVGAPSVHPSGARYRWIVFDRLGPAPSWLVGLIRPRYLSVTVAPVTVAPVRATAYGRGALRRELDQLARAEKGTRNHRLYVAARHLGELVGAGALDEQDTVDRLIESGARLFGDDARPNEVERTVANGMSTGMEQPRSMAR